MKDWKLLKNDDDFIQWWNEKTGTGVFVYYQDYADYVKKKNHWVFTVNKNGGKKVVKEVNKKSKEEALRLAKSYMRSH